MMPNGGKIGWGFIGASNIARQRMLGAVRASQIGEIVALMSHRRELAEPLAAEFGIPTVYDSVDALLEDRRVQAVYVSSTNERHHAQVLAAAARGKHVLCEKPLATTLGEATDMVAACRRAGVLLGTNHHLRNAVVLNAIRDQIAGGAIGAAVSIQASQPMYCPPQDWRRRDPSKGAGVGLDILVHTADSVRFVLQAEPIAVAAMAQSSTRMTGGAFDTILATYRFDNGAIAQLHADFNTPAGRTRLDVHGLEGSIFGCDVLGKMAGFPGTAYLRRGDSLRVLAVESDASRYTRSVDRFNAAIRGEGAPACSGVDGVRSLAMVLAAEEAARCERVVAIGRDGLDPS
jgi:1,5-anhydro-D-fructose reductase (1,5-anhydro-D-mannitol-forming)